MESIVYLIGILLLYNAFDVISAANDTFVCGTKYLTASDEYRFLQSPNYPNHYPNNVDCIWTITGRTTVDLEVLYSSIKSDYFCQKDNLTAYNGWSINNRLKTWCGIQTPTISSYGRHLTLRFQTDQSGVSAGFRLRYRNSLVTCGGDLLATTVSRIFRSPGYPDSYPNNLNCTWIIRTTSSNIKLEVINSRLETSYNCIRDYVKVYDIGTDYLLGTFCGFQAPTYYSTTPSMRVVFVTNSWRQEEGFKIRYTAVSYTERCGSMSLRAYSFTEYLQSPGYPNTYLNNLNCTWVITTEQAYTIKLTIVDADIRPGCEGNSVKVYDGPTAYSPLLGKFCSNLRSTYVSSNNTITVSIQTNGAVGRGFKLLYQRGNFSDAAGCGNKFLRAYDYYHYLKSPGYPFEYPNNLDCKWTITTLSFYDIRATLLDVDIQYGCGNDEVDFFDGSTTNSSLLGRVCSSEPQDKTFVSKGDMIVTFKTDRNTVRKGFKLSYMAGYFSCRNTKTLIARNYELFLASPGFPNQHSSHLDCKWTITTSYGYTIKVTVLNSTFADCQHCFLSIHDGSTSDGLLLARFCGGSTETFVSSGTAMMLVFKTDADRKGANNGFRLSYKSGRFSDTCGTTRIAGLVQQFLTSPGYPNDYTDNADCTWTLKSNYPDFIIYIEVTDINIEYQYDCYGDYLQVFDGRNGDGKSLGTWCGMAIPNAIRSSGRYVMIKFHSDANGVSSGFKLSYKSEAKSSNYNYQDSTLNTSAIIGGLAVGCVLVVTVICFAAYRARKNSRSVQSRNGRSPNRQSLRRRVYVIGCDGDATERGPATFAGPPSYEEVMAEAPPPYSEVDVPAGNPTSGTAHDQTDGGRDVDGRGPTADGRGIDGREQAAAERYVDRRVQADDGNGVAGRKQTAARTDIDGQEKSVDGEVGEREQTYGEEEDWFPGRLGLNAIEEGVDEPGVDAPDTQPILPTGTSSEC